MNGTSPLLEIVGVDQSYGTHPVLRGLTLSLSRGAIGCLLGPSGCGKTTVLRCIAGFEPIAAGEIRLDGEVVSHRELLVPPERRRIGMVFQDYALFPHRTVEGNVGFRLHALTRTARETRVAELLDVVGLSDAGGKYPHELSGGQQQRVALARALAPRPALLLLDEPFSNLDVELRARLSGELRQILKRENATALMVTHDQNEAFGIADETGIMYTGVIAQWDTPYNLYHRPATRFIADFIGQGVFLPGTVLNQGRIKSELGIMPAPLPHEWSAGEPVDMLVRPDDILHDDASPFQAEVEQKAFRGAEFLYTLRLPGGGRVLSLVPSHHNHSIGEKIGIRLEIDHLVAFRRTGGS